MDQKSIVKSKAFSVYLPNFTEVKMGLTGDGSFIKTVTLLYLYLGDCEAKMPCYSC